MCGIVHVKRKDGKPANRSLLKRYNHQSHRGTQGFGFVELKDGKFGAEVRAQTEDIIEEKLEQSKASEILFHHRFPTSTPNFVEATHPILVDNKILKYYYYIVHNGVISNDDVLKLEHEKLGFSYLTEIRKKYVTRGQIYSSEMWNDSEALAIDFCLSLERGEAMKASGSIAMIALQFDKKTHKAVALYFGRNGGNPLKMENGKDFFALSSETGAMIDENKLYRLDYETDDLTVTDFKIGVYTEYYSQGSMGFVGQSYRYEDLDDYDASEFSKWRKGTTKDWEDRNKTEEEDSFDWELYEEMEELEEKKRQAEVAGDYDTMTDTQIRIEEIRTELELDEEIEDYSFSSALDKSERLAGGREF